MIYYRRAARAGGSRRRKRRFSENNEVNTLKNFNTPFLCLKKILLNYPTFSVYWTMCHMYITCVIQYVIICGVLLCNTHVIDTCFTYVTHVYSLNMYYMCRNTCVMLVNLLNKNVKNYHFHTSFRSMEIKCQVGSHLVI